ncbi:MAG: hypothetical protein ACLSEX_11345 [Blautia sp.]
MGMLESGMSNPQIAQFMREEYYVGAQKTALGITIANREREILKGIDYENGYSLYVGIPFCPSICLYCSFSSYPTVSGRSGGRVCGCAEKEIRETAKLLKAGRWIPSTWGGTPPLCPRIPPPGVKLYRGEFSL